MVHSNVLAALVLASLTALVSGCAADTEDTGSSEDAVRTEGTQAAAAEPRCTIEAFKMDTWPTVEPQTAEMKTFIEDRIAKAKNGRFTLEDYGPYQLMRFKLRVRGTASAVTAKLSYLHTLPGKVAIPEQVVWTGELPANFEQEVTSEVYYDPDQYGLGADAPRFGKNAGQIHFSCASKAGKSSDSQSYAFTRSAG